MSTSLVQIKAKNQSRYAEEKRQIDRTRNIMVLLLHHCINHGYIETAEKLQNEAGVTLSKYAVADNVDLQTIVQEFEDYYEIKFGKRPVLVRRLDAESAKDNASALSAKKAAAERRNRRNNYKSSAMPDEARVENNVALKNASNAAKAGARGQPSKRVAPSNNNNNGPARDEEGDAFSIGLVGQKPAQSDVRITAAGKQGSSSENREEESEDVEERLIKPLPQFDNDPELRGLAQTITRDIFQSNPNVRWSDVVELDDAKRLLKEAVVMPIKYPQFFSGLLSPWCGILLFGPPGTGKTMLAKAVATECRTTFFNISASSIVSKYRGDSEKLVRMLFDLARYHAPSTIFLDEIDSIMGQRGGGDGGGQEHEASRRMKTELLIQMDGLAKSDELVFVLAASNLPWELDIAMLRRLEKRVLVTLPGPSARKAMLEKCLEPYIDEGFDFDQAVAATNGYSGADIKLVAKEAAMGPVRRLLSKIENASEADDREPEVYDENNLKQALEKVSIEDIKRALEKTKPSAFRFSDKYEAWQNECGST